MNKTNVKISLFAAGCLVFCAGFLRAGEIANGVFTVNNTKTLNVTYQGEPFMVDDEINYLKDLEGADEVVMGKNGKIRVLNVIQKNHDAVLFRKEVALHPDGHLELTVNMRLLPYKNVPDKKSITYSFKIPAKVLDGTKFKAITGRTYALKTVEGEFSAQRADGNLVSGCRYIAFEGGKTRIVFDANPYGVVSASDYCSHGEPVGVCSVIKQGTNLVFSFGQSARFHGIPLAWKLLVYEGAFDYDKRHAYKEWSYGGATPAMAQFSFGAPAVTNNFAKADCLEYSAERKWGWAKAKGLSIPAAASPDPLDHCTASDSGNTFLMDVTPGYYVATLRVGHNSIATGPFNVLLNGECLARDVQVPAGETKTLLLAKYVRAPERQLKIAFEGNAWALRSVVIHPIIYQNEDFTFDRELWAAKGLYVPDIKIEGIPMPVADSPASRPPTDGFVSASYTGASAPVGVKEFTPVVAIPEVLLPADSDALAWRYDMKMVDWAGSCAGMVYDLYTPEQIERRAAELEAAGINTVIVSGLHYHHNYLEQWPMIVKNMKAITEAAHRHRIKVIFHHDIPVIDYSGKGLHELVKHLGWLVRDIEFDRPSLRCFCIMNPDFRRAYFDRLTNLVRETNIDGVMLDEAAFVDKNFCGCEHCRTAFTKVTGVVLPRKNTGEVFFKMDNPVWLAWLNWRKRAVGDWWVEMRKAFNTVNPDLCIMTYTTHYGFDNHWAPNSLGADINQCARACDFLGTEIMSRNVYDSYRPVYAYRKAKASLGALYGAPIYGLVYHCDDPNAAYVGWAMNHMNRQTSWMSSIEGENMGRYLDWPKRMQCRFAQPVSDVAILFSTSARDFGRYCGCSPDGLGISQCLSDAHVQHDFIMEGDLLNADKLADYKLLILPSAGNLSKRQAEAVRKYVKNGGRLLATAHASALNEFGFDQGNFQLADVLGVDAVVKGKSLTFLSAAPRKIVFKNGGMTVDYPGAVLRTTVRKGAEVQAEMPDAVPAIVSNSFGKGSSWYAPFQPGAFNYETEWSAHGEAMTYEKNREVAGLLVRLVQMAASAPFDFIAVEMPEKVLASVARQETGGKQETLVHLLNLTGANLKKGDPINYNVDWAKRGNPFPPLEKDLVFDIRADGISRAYLVSPDYTGERSVTIEKRDNGIQRVTVKKEDLKAYGIVYLEQGSK